MKYIKLFESYFLDPIIYKIGGMGLRILGFKRTPRGYDWNYQPISEKYKRDISNIFNGIDFEFVESESESESIVLHFTKPKRIPKCTVNIHTYDPADVYYTIRISLYNDEWWTMRWFGVVYATQEHIENYYKKWPHLKSRTFNRDNVEMPSYSPPMYGGYGGSRGDSFSSSDRKDYLCDQFDSLEFLLNQFKDFLQEEKLRFDTNYPDFEESEMRPEDAQYFD
jgi:hypothetical protein